MACKSREPAAPSWRSLRNECELRGPTAISSACSCHSKGQAHRCCQSWTSRNASRAQLPAVHLHQQQLQHRHRSWIQLQDWQHSCRCCCCRDVEARSCCLIAAAANRLLKLLCDDDVDSSDCKGRRSRSQHPAGIVELALSCTTVKQSAGVKRPRRHHGPSGQAVSKKGMCIARHGLIVIQKLKFLRSFSMLQT